MTVLDTLAKTPFNLLPDDIAWVKKTRDSLSAEQKVAQIFCSMSLRDDPAAMKDILSRKPGGMLRYMGPDLEAAWKATRMAVETSEIPLLISGDLEGGAYGQPYFSPVLNQIGVAACNDSALSESLADVLAREGRAMGYNWSYTPVVDINAKFRSAIVGTRSYGSNVDTIIREATTHINTLQRNGVAATAKHWPGEGYDDRDQHLVTTINPLSVEEWEQSFGKIYRSMINTGVMSVMSAHIALPSWVRKKFAMIGSEAGIEAFRPGSVSKLLNQDLLRGELGFNGLVVSDATPMAGFTSWAEREKMAPEVIENGCDMFLFGFPDQRDLALLMNGLREGRLSEQRLDDAVTRVLGLKAALGLHKKTVDELLPPLDSVRATLRAPSNLAVTTQAAKKTITLIKDTKSILPLQIAKHKRIVVITEGIKPLLPGGEARDLRIVVDGLKARGFEVRHYDATKPPPSAADTDLVLYLIAQESMFSLSHIFIDWRNLHGGLFQALMRFWCDVPAVMVSFGQMYYLYDAPRVPAYINAYTALPAVQEALVRKITGEEPFEGTSPVDAFCGLEDARY
jgi:beta-N-acetylhexosaminidase